MYIIHAKHEKPDLQELSLHVHIKHLKKSQRKEIKNSNLNPYNIYMYIIHIKHEKPNLQEITFEFQNTALNAHVDQPNRMNMDQDNDL